MPSDSNGVYALPPGYAGTTGNAIQTSQHNPIFEDVAAAITGRLAVNGANAMTGPLKHPDGTAVAPPIAFVSATGTGIYKTASGLGIAIGGVKVAEFTANGLASGARYVGELFHHSLSTAPALCVLVYGQTLSRAAFPDLWTVAQVEIAAGNTFYNNGNGTTTFGIGDSRGRVLAGADAMGGVAANRLTASYFGANGQVIGNTGGGESASLGQPNLPNVNFIVSGGPLQATTDTAFNRDALISITQGSGVVQANMKQSNGVTNAITIPITGQGIVAASGGTAAPFRTVQPTMAVTCALFAGA
jgi:microcystin-dependent protein